MKVHVGTSGWSYAHWHGVLYPHGVSPRERLDYYLMRYRTAELNSSYYRWPAGAQNLYFLAHDTDVDRMPATAFAMKDFKRMLENNVRARRMVLFVDTCHSAGLTGSRGESSRGIENNLISLYAEKLLYQQEGKAVLTASDVNESSQESPRWGGGHGVFTHFLLEGMGGMADSNVDLVVTVGELFRFVRQRVRLDTEYRQNPRMLVGTNEDLALAAVAASGRR